MRPLLRHVAEDAGEVVDPLNHDHRERGVPKDRVALLLMNMEEVMSMQIGLGRLFIHCQADTRLAVPLQRLADAGDLAAAKTLALCVVARLRHDGDEMRE